MAAGSQAQRRGNAGTTDKPGPILSVSSSEHTTSIPQQQRLLAHDAAPPYAAASCTRARDGEGDDERPSSQAATEHGGIMTAGERAAGRPRHHE
jgi:hypothetical protein